MALPQLIPSHSSSSLTHQPSINPNAANPYPMLKSFLKPSSLSQSRRFHRFSSLRASASSFPDHHQTDPSKPDDVVELPIFPLPLVLFPGAILPLQIFEFRYRIMMHTLLHTDLRFGVIYSDSVTWHHRRQERFRITNVVRTKPYLVAEVNWLEDRPSGDEDLEGLASEVETYMKDVIRLSNRLNGKPEKETLDLRRNLFPTPFSFFVGSTFEGAPREQQALLELEDTATRLKREKETLRNTLNYLSAASAVKDVFPSS
ncbi:hypothetical protein GOBAR_DD22279 [Gossypium barbadense]|nr:hypothetical protein GOBAR_DD22279 [Gossypium barbadense]